MPRRPLLTGQTGAFDRPLCNRSVVRNVMKNRVLAAAVIIAASAVVANPAYATGVYPPIVKHPPKHHHHNGHAGKLIVGCIFGSALGAIGSALRVSRSENRELTHAEAATAISFCGLGAFALHTRPVVAQPQRVVARY